MQIPRAQGGPVAHACSLLDGCVCPQAHTSSPVVARSITTILLGKYCDETARAAASHDSEVSMSDDAFGPLEDAFFAAGEAYAQQADEPFDPEAHVEAHGHDSQPEQARLRPWLAGARTRIILQARLLQFRVAVALSTYAEHALRVAVSGVPGHGFLLGMVRQTFIPAIAVTNPVLARASLFVLVFTAATFPAAAVLAATGVL